MTQTKKRYKDMVFGDIIYTQAPFEETTPDYYNGYTAKDIRGEDFSVNGKTGKIRPVMVVGVVDNNLIYTTITSSRNKFTDDIHQYTVEDVSVMPGDKNVSYIELDGIRAKPIQEHWKETYCGCISDVDMKNLKSSMIKRALNTDEKDRYSYIGDKNGEKLTNALKQYGFSKDQNKYHKNDYSITFHNDGIIHHHFERSIMDVRARIEQREQITLPTMEPLSEVIDNLERDLNDAQRNL